MMEESLEYRLPGLYYFADMLGFYFFCICFVLQYILVIAYSLDLFSNFRKCNEIYLKERIY